MANFKMRNTDVGPLSEYFTGLGVLTDRLSARDADKLLEDGADFMRSVVPKDQGGLAASIVVQPVSHTLFSAAESSYRGAVGSPLLLARRVDQGTGVDGPFHMSVSVTRPSRKNPDRPGAMRFYSPQSPDANSAGFVFRKEVKFHHSAKIIAGKGFVKRTDEYMRLRAAELLREMQIEIKSHNSLFSGASVRRPR